MDKDVACHNIATSCAKLFVESNLPEYKVSGYSKLVEDCTAKYSEAYNQAKDLLKTPPAKVKILDKKDLGL